MYTDDLEKKRKTQFFTMSCCAALGLLCILAVYNIMNGLFPNLILDLVLMVILLTSYIALRTLKAELIIYRLGTVTLNLAILYIVATGLVGERILYALFFMPIMLFFFFNKKEGAIWCTAYFTILCFLVLQPFPLGTYQYTQPASFHFIIVLLFVTITAYQLESSREHYSELFLEGHAKLQKEKKHLEDALEQIKTLSGMLPICSSCKKIRDDKGYWNKIDQYIAKHSDVQFSHSICPDCANKLYPYLNTDNLK